MKVVNYGGQSWPAEKIASWSEETFFKAFEGVKPLEELKRVHTLACETLGVEKRLTDEVIQKSTGNGNNGGGNAKTLSGDQSGTGSNNGGSSKPGSAGGLQPGSTEKG
jgi:hypothetical protein